MWPNPRRPYNGIFVKEQLNSIRDVEPGLELDVLWIDGHASRFNYVLGIRRIRRRTRKNRYDLVHAHYGLTGAAAILAGASPLVVTFHGSDAGFSRWQTRVSKLVAGRAECLIGVSPRMRSALGRSDLTVIPCGVDLTLFRRIPRDLARHRLGMDHAGPLILFPADPGIPVKGFQLFKEILLELRRRRPNVRWRPIHGVNREEVPTLLSAADALVMTSLAEGSPMVVKEALACDLPCVSVDVGDVGSVLATVPHCQVTRRDPVAMADTIETILAGGHRAPGRDRVRQLGLDSQTVARRVVALYHEVAADRPAGAKTHPGSLDQQLREQR
jgi:glycosyltransferase involved in cell wall biosynthesis